MEEDGSKCTMLAGFLKVQYAACTTITGQGVHSERHSPQACVLACGRQTHRQQQDRHRWSCAPLFACSCSSQSVAMAGLQ
eukprot:6184965-Pleurochrysis_carterae.AAC.4